MATVSTTTGTYLSNLFDPEVIGQMINEKLIKNIVFAPLANIDNTLVGTAGDEVTMPYFEYIGMAADVAEGADIPISQLNQKTKKVKIHKIGKGVQITDEAVLSGYGDPVGEAIKQIITSIADRVDAKLLTALSENTAHVYNPASELTAGDMPTALAMFGEEIEGQKALIVDPTFYAKLVKDDWIPASEIAANIRIRGTVGMAYGMQVIVSERVATGDNFYIVKPGALAIFMKRDTMVESDRDIINQSTVLAGSKLFAPYLYKPGNAITIKKTHQTTQEVTRNDAAQTPGG